MRVNVLRTNNFESILLNKAKGSWVWDTEGKKYLDCESGMWCVNLGHNHTYINTIMKHQLDKIIHRNKSFLTPMTIKAIEEILEFVPGEYNRCTLLNSGTEAVEFAINLARKITTSAGVLSLQSSYLGAYGTAKTASYTSNSTVEDVYKLPHHYCNGTNCICIEKYRPIIEHIFEELNYMPACFVLEPIMVSGGIFKPCKNLVRYICDKVQQNGGLLIIDEVTTGLGRSGQKLGVEHFDISPDVVVLGKALGNGYPVSAVVTKSEWEEKLIPQELYYVQSHQLDPLGSVIASAVLKVYQDERISSMLPKNNQRIDQILHDVEHPSIKAIRSYGMIFGVELQAFNDMSVNDVVVKVKDRLLQNGVIVGYSTSKNLLRLLPPLNIKDEEIDYLMQQLLKTFNNI